ncbi:MAG: energy-coupling factor ABC transporter permease [Wenzhouxiangella sp.]
MNFTTELIPLWLSLLCLPLFVAITAWNIWGSPWTLLKQNQLHPLFSLTIGLLTGLWLLQVGGHPGLEFHLLGLTTVVLIFGWRLAMVAGASALFLQAIVGLHDWTTLGISGLLGVVLPVLLADRLHRLIYRWLPKHFFVYVMAAAHFSSMLVIGAVIVAGGLLLWSLGVHPMDRVLGDYFVFMPLVLIPEGFLNGAIMTLLIILRPEWVRSFDDRDYIDGK